MRIGSLFSGAGGLDLAVQAVFGGEVVWHAEIDKAASKVLAYRFPGVLNLGDVSDINWDSVPPVDVLCGGFPCQDVSAAGKRAGIKAGTRSGLWAVFAEAIDALRPRWVVIENVRGLLSATAERAVESGEDAVGNGAGRPVLRAAGAVLGDLADLGYDAQWATVAAADVGAPHRRERVFIVAADTAISSGAGLQQQDLSALQQRRGDRRPGQSGVCACGGAACVADAAHSSRYGRDEGRAESAGIVGGFDAAVSGDEPGVALLPTPSTHDKTGARSPESIARMGKPFADGHNACLPVELAGTKPEPGVALLPTPRSSDCFGAGRHGDGGMDLRTTVTLLSTPQSRDYKGRPSDGFNNANLCRDVALLCTPSASDGAGGKTSSSGGRIDEPLLGGQAREMATSWGKYEPAIRRWEQATRPAPAPTEPNKNGNPRLSAAFSEWLMGWPAGWVTDPNIGISRNDQLRIVGNGVCPQQAAYALNYLMGVA